MHKGCSRREEMESGRKMGGSRGNLRTLVRPALPGKVRNDRPSVLLCWTSLQIEILRTIGLRASLSSTNNSSKSSLGQKKHHHSRTSFVEKASSPWVTVIIFLFREGFTDSGKCLMLWISVGEYVWSSAVSWHHPVWTHLLGLVMSQLKMWMPYPLVLRLLWDICESLWMYS